MKFLVYLGLLVLTSFALRRYLFPYLLGRLTPIRINSISLRNIRGLEWHPRRGNAGEPLFPLKVERIGWEWCAKGHWGIRIIAEQIDLSLDHDLGESTPMGEPAGKAQRGSPAQMPELVKRQLVSQLKRYFQPAILSFGMKYLPSVLHLIQFRISDVRLSLKDQSVTLLLDSIDASFDVTYEEPPAFVTPETALSPETPMEPWSPIPGSFFPLPLVDEQGEVVEELKNMDLKKVRSRGWNSLWRKVMGRASGQVEMTLVVSRCRVLKTMEEGKENKRIADVVTLAEDSNFTLSMAFGPLKPEKSRHTSKRFALPHAVIPRLSAYLAVDKITFDGKLSPITFDVRELEGILRDHQSRRKASVSRGSHSVMESRQAELKRARNKQLAGAIGRAIERISIAMPNVTMQHSVEASYLGPKIAATEQLETGVSHDSGLFAAYHSSPDRPSTNRNPVDDINLAFVVEDLSFQARSVNQSNSSDIRQFFGRPVETASAADEIVRGLELDMSFQDFSVQRIDKRHSDRHSTLLSTGWMEFKAMTTMFSDVLGWPGVPAYIDEPNHHLLQMEFKVHHFDLHVSLDLLTQLILEARTTAAHRKMNRVPQPIWDSPSNGGHQQKQVNHKVPKLVVVVEVGNIDIRLADAERHSVVECHITNSGLHIAGHTEHYDVCARILNKDPRSKPRFVLSDGFTSGISWDCGGEIAKTTIGISSLTNGNQTQCSEIIRVGQGFLKSRGSALGRSIQSTGTIDLDSRSQIGDLTLSFNKGVDVRLWKDESHRAVATLLTSMEHCQSMLRRPRNDTQNAVMPDPLRTLPSGISFKLSLGTVSIVLASRDPNPACRIRLVRGLHLQTAITLDYCYYAHEEQVRRSSRLLLALQHRSKLHLSPGLETEAEALANKHLTMGGGAALFGVNCKKTLLEPIFNAQAFTASAETPEHFPTASEIFPAKTRHNSYTVWDFQKKMDKEASETVFSNNQDPFGINFQQQIRRPIFTIPDAICNINLLRQKHDSPIERQILSRIGYVEISGDLSHIHCALLATQALKNCRNPRPAPGAAIATADGVQRAITTTLRMRVDYFEVDVLFPIGERIFGSFSELHLVHRVDGQAVTMQSGMLFVPSAREDSKFEELGRFKSVVVTVQAGKPHSIGLEADALRIRIPYKYEPSKLILNINAAVKASRLLLRGIQSGRFHVQLPRARGPKAIPMIAIRCKATSFEIKDDPLETKLNLSFRVGKTESAPRAERREYFEAKATLIQNVFGPLEKDVDPTPRNELERIRESYHVTLDHTVSVPEARDRLFQYDSKRWIHKMDKAMSTQNRREGRELIRQYGYKTDYSGLPIEVVSPQRFAPLFRASLGDLHIGIVDPKLEPAAVLQHMEARGGAFPSEQQFSLLVPMQIQLTSANVDLTLRDYPLPLWRIMPMDGSTDDIGRDIPAMTCELTLVVAEELIEDDESYFLIPCNVLPSGTGDSDAAAFEVEIAKTLAPVKSYADAKFTVHSPRPTDFTWGISYQPALADLARAFASFSRPPRDPSPRVGFWDKFRLSLHWRVAFDFAAPCHLHLKGSRDPYEITGHGAGFVLAWMGNPGIRIGYENPERELIQIFSKQMVLSVPDLTAFLDPVATGDKHDPHIDTGKKTEELPSLLNRRLNKTCANFRGGVCVGFAFKFERTCRDDTCEHGCQGKASMRQCRFFDFIPHHAVKLRTPQMVERLEKETGIKVDSFEGFRSDFIHFSPSIVANRDGDRDQASSFHFTPMGFAHFFAWWGLFSHVMSLPIRQGALFPSSPPKSKKFGQSLATIKYRFDIRDLYISHMYPQYSQQEWANGFESGVGIKWHIARFQADMHQREQFQIKRSDALGVTTPTHKAFYAGEVILADVKVKAIRAVFVSPVRHALEPTGQRNDDPVSPPRGVHAKDLDTPEADWFHIDDYIDINVRPVDDNPLVEFHTVLSTPLCRYSRYIPALRVSSEVVAKLRAGKVDATETAASKFGREPSHKCLLSEAPVLEDFNDHLLTDRISRLRNIREGAQDGLARAEMDKRIQILEDCRDTLHSRMQTPEYAIDRKNSVDGFDARDRMAEREGAGYENVFHIHHPRLAINNTSRNIYLQYYFSSRMRRGFEYHMSHKAVSDLDKQLKKGFQPQASELPPVGELHKPHLDLNDVALKMGSTLAAGILGQLLGSGTTTEDHLPESRNSHSCEIAPADDLPKEFGIRKSMFGIMTQPQILLSSEIDDSSTILLTANVAKLRSFKVEDGEFAGDKVKGTVMRRNYGVLDGLQSFCPSDDSKDTQLSATFVPLEILLDTKLKTTAFDRLVTSTQCSVRLDKFNQLRLVNRMKNNPGSSEHLKNHQDLAIVNVPTFGVVANSRHFAAIYNILTDLVLYQDPEQRQRSQQLDTFIYSFDAEDSHRYTTEVKLLQNRIREQESTFQLYEEHYARLSAEGKLEIGRVRADLLEDVQKLALIFDAIAILQSHGKAAAELRSSLRLEAHAQELAWFMLDEDKLLAKLAIKDIHYTWVRKKDSSTENALVIRDLQALNTSPDAYYVEIISRFDKAAARNEKPMVRVSWSALAPVGGISILESFKLQLHPLRVQLERAIGKSINDYVFQNRPSKEVAPERKAKKKERSADAEQLDGALVSRRKQHLGIHRSSSGIFNHIPAGSPTLSRRSSFSESSNSRPQMHRSLSTQEASLHSLQRQAEADAAEMRSRATRNRTFVSIDIDPTVLLFSYKSEKTKSFSNVQDIRVKTPHLLYENKVWSFEDLTSVMRRDMLQAAWNQKGQLLSDIFRMKTKPLRDQHPPGPSSLSITHYAHHRDNDTAVETVIQQADQSHFLPDTVALVQTPEQVDESLPKTSLEGNGSMYASPAPSQQSLETSIEGKKSSRMNRLITKLRHPRV